ncbi:cyclic AMP-dependent transcription factor ATF-6 alpha-like isoform X2 [Lineus longissimus]|uniref:cyclic AMP-dependent transcription factor ATF-6 alpha-like isoform X2 n=1 Tax=Lineus longissimus TaxID=88925 RepID=UPI002B4C83D6
MAVDFLSDADSRFFGDGMLQNDDWGDPNLNSLDDFPSFLDTELSTDDLMREFNTEIPMFDDHSDILSLALREENSLNRSSSSDSGIASDLGVKHEPLSPASSFSSDSDSAGSNMDCQILSSEPSCLNTCIKLENPPLTPPRDPNDIISPLSMHNFCRSNQPITTPMHATSIKTEPLASHKTRNGITQILNNKVKIVPKPVVTTTCLPTTLQNGTPGKPLILTPDEFARLTAQGVLKFQPPLDAKPVLKTVAPDTTQVTGTATNSTYYSAEPTVKVMKRQQRMIKNRESACLSRRRKKEYVTSLEDRMKQFNQENERLKQENMKLQQKVNLLTQENDQLRKTVPSKRTAATFLLAVMLVFSLNMGPLSNVLMQSPDKSMNIPSPEIHHGRTLMSLIDEKGRSEDVAKSNQTDHDLVQAVKKIQKSVLSQNSTDYKDMLMKSLETLSTFTLCPTHFNRSESLRLANELTGWVLGHKSEMKQKEAERAQRKASKLPKRHRPLKVLKAAMEGKLSTQLEQPQASVGESKNYQVQLFNSHEKNYHEFLDAIQRRNDTFYVVSFRRDHLLLPATAHNKTMRPRMSLVMPAVSLNDSMQPPVGSVAMMQIDCEVMNTKLIHVTKSTVPKHMWEANNTMSPVPGEEKEVTDGTEDEARKWNLRYKPRKIHP